MAVGEGRDAEALALFVKGTALKEIAEAIGFSSAQAAHSAVKRAISCAVKPDALVVPQSPDDLLLSGTGR